MSERQAERGAARRDGGERDDLFWQDELLQVLYWLTGEGLGPDVRWSDLQVLTDGSDAVLLAAARGLAARGLVQVTDREGLPALRLTPAGMEEGRRRFVDQFADLLGQAHGECGPDCECHRAEPGQSCWERGAAAGA